MVEVKIGSRTYEVSEDKASELKREYSGQIEIKEFYGAEQILIIIGGLVLGRFAADVADKIASEIEDNAE